MTPARARLAVLAVFAAGFVCGAAALHAYRLRVEKRIFHSQDVLAQLIVFTLDRELTLTPAQKNEVRETVIASRSELLKWRRELMPQVLEAYERGQTRIRATLTPEQRVKFDAIVAERRRLMKDLDMNRGEPASVPPALRSPLAAPEGLRPSSSTPAATGRP